ncbi:MAG: two-component regulator propeller domain-containing protein [Candidatus Eiseniibacteriota bacterium]
MRPAAALALALTLSLTLAGAWPAAAQSGAAEEVWSTFIDGTVHHLSIGLGESPERLKHDPLASDGNGMLWAASSGGLTGFDSVDSTETRLFRNDGLPAQDVSCVEIDAAGNLWVGTRADGLTARDPAGRWLRRPLDRFDLGSDSLRVIIEAGDALWAGTASSAVKLRYPDDPDVPGEGSILELVNLASFLGTSPLVNAIVAIGDTTWVGTEHGVVRLEPGLRRLENEGLSGAELEVRALAMHDAHLWAATEGGVFRREDGRWVARGNGVDPTRPPRELAHFDGDLVLGVRSGDSVYRLDDASLTWTALGAGFGAGRPIAGLREVRGRLWAATDRGLWVLGTDMTWRALPSPDPPSSTFIGTDFDYVDVVAMNGGAWAVTRSLVTRFDGDAWSGLRRGAGGIENTAIRRLAIDGDGNLFVGHCCCGTGTTCRVDQLDAALGGGAIALPAYDAFAAVTAPDGRIWFGSVETDQSNGEGLYRYDPGTGELVQYTRSGGGGAVPLDLSSTSITALAIDTRGRLWIGHQSEGVQVWSDPGNPASSLRSLDQFSDGLPSNRTTGLAAAPDGVWVATSSGLGKVNEDLLVVRTVLGDVLPSAAVNAVAVDGCGRVWVATGAGVARLTGTGEIEALYDDSTTPGPADERVSAIAVDAAAAEVWLATRLGLSRVAYDASCRGGSGIESVRCTTLCPYPNPLRLDRGQRQVALTGAAAGLGVTVLDARGSEVWSGIAAADGTVWDGRDAAGERVPSGVYLMSIETGDGRETRPLAVIR